MVGWRQHAERLRSRSPRRTNSLGWGPELVEWMREYGRGKLPAAGVVRNARTKCKAGTANAIVKQLSQGERGDSLQNAERVVRSIVPMDRLPPQTAIADSTIDVIVDPYTMFHWLRKTNPLKFATGMGARGDLVDFWAALKSRPIVGERHWASHPWLRGRTPESLRRHIPIIVFDDAGPCSKTLSTYCRCFYAILGKGAEWDSRFLISTGFKTEGEDHSWHAIVKGFEKLSLPVTPDDEWGGIWLFFGADLDYAANELGLAHTSAAHMCAFCNANITDIPFNDASVGAMWKATIRDEHQFALALRERNGGLHPLSGYGLLTMYTYRLCMMHVFDHNGLSGHIIASSIHTWCTSNPSILPGATIDVRLDHFNSERKAFYSCKKVKNRMPPLHWCNVKQDGGFAELHGHFVKAANTRGIVPLIKDLADRQATLYPTDENKHIAKITTALHNMYELLYSTGPFLNVDQMKCLRWQCDQIGIHMQWLAVDTARRGLRRWKCPPKFHYAIAHFAEQAQLLNPVYCQGYRSESMVGKTTCIYKSLLDGPRTGSIQTKALQKYTLALLLDWAPENTLE